MINFTNTPLFEKGTTDNLAIADSEYTEKAAQYTETSAKLNNYCYRLLTILKNINEENAIQGQRAKKIQGFTVFIEEHIVSKLRNTVHQQTQDMNKYMYEVDERDYFKLG